MIALDSQGRRTAVFNDLSLTYFDASKATPSGARNYAFDPRLHSHTYVEVLLVVKGKSKIVSVAQGLTVSAPYLVVYLAGVPHIQINHMMEGYERCLLACYDDVLERNGCGHMLDNTGVYAFGVDEHSAKVFVALFQLILAIGNEQGGEYDKLLGRMFALLSKMSTSSVHIHEDGEPIYEKAYMSTLLSYIVDHYNEKLSLTSLASTFYISRTKLARDFSSIMKMSVGEYIMGVRLRKAQEKLLKGTSIAETAKKCGFVSTSYFVQMFKKHYNKTPLHYVKQGYKGLPNFTFMLDEALVDSESIKHTNEINQEENT